VQELVGVRQEDPEVFELTHATVLRLVAEGLVDGFRVDHVDGLADPAGYLRRLAGRGVPWVVVEKILAEGERLPDWPVAGTTGYDFLNAINGIFVARENEQKLQRIYFRFIDGGIDFEELVYQKKKLVLYTAMAAEMNLLARQLNRISEGNRWTRDFTLYALRAALIEVIACFPVYRTYIEEPGHVDERDRRYVLQAVACAKRHNPAENASIYEFIADILLQKFAAYVDEKERPAQHAFALKLQQVLGPVMAKGLEDTAFYVYNRLVSLNEVGGEP
jgi:(1->4)-alpha-D-glucan 1-alpha-D-glucosylmutase